MEPGGLSNREGGYSRQGSIEDAANFRCEARLAQGRAAMSHKSRVCAVLIDTAAKSHEVAARYWAGALGRELQYSAAERYASLKGVDLDFLIQRVEPGHEGVHFDIETDDVDAEVTRLERLGAKRVRQVKKWWVMEAPGGHRFCVVPVQSTRWPEGATEWTTN